MPGGTATAPARRRRKITSSRGSGSRARPTSSPRPWAVGGCASSQEKPGAPRRAGVGGRARCSSSDRGAPREARALSLTYSDTRRAPAWALPRPWRGWRTPSIPVGSGVHGAVHRPAGRATCQSWPKKRLEPNGQCAFLYDLNARPGGREGARLRRRGCAGRRFEGATLRLHGTRGPH
jgi:hypothetical protein